VPTSPFLVAHPLISGLGRRHAADCALSVPGAAPGPGQLRHAQDPRDPSLAPEAARFHLHFTPTSSSWLNLVERWFAELTNRKLRRSAHRSIIQLEADIRKWINEWNKDPRPFVLTKTAYEILETLAAYCERINDSGH
jgi:hypothetical protein